MSASRCASSNRVALALLLAALGLPVSASADETSYVHRLAQGSFFLERGLVSQALEEFEAAALSPEGQAAHEVHELIAKTRYQLGQIGGAVEAARMAAALAPRLDPEFAEFHEFLTTRFGKVLVIGASSEGANRPAPATPLLDPELKRAYQSARLAMDSMEDGSTSVYLPVGSYRVGEHIVEVEARGVARMDLRPAVDASGSGVYGERRGKEPASRRAERPQPLGALLLQLGAGAYGQQGRAGGLGRGGAAAELGLGVLALDLGVSGMGWRAERLQGEGSAPGAGAVMLRVGAALSLPAGGRVTLGPRLGGMIGGSWPLAAALPSGYLGPRAYLVHGLELGLRAAGVRDGPAPVFGLAALLLESVPQGDGLGALDRKPHLTLGITADLGVRL